MKEHNTRYNTNGVNIEERIESGMTKFFEKEDRNTAIEFAKDKGSYVDECFEYDKHENKKFAGYTVPK